MTKSSPPRQTAFHRAIIGVPALAAVLTLSACLDASDAPSGVTPVASGPAPAFLPASIPTSAGDTIRVISQPGSGSGPVTLCLSTQPGMWKKDIAVSGGPTLRSEDGTTDCAQVPATNTRFETIKAMTFGVMTGVGFASLDLTGWGGGQVTLNWVSD